MRLVIARGTRGPWLAFVGMVGCLPSRAQSPAAPVSAEGATWTDERGESVVLERFRGAPVVFTAFFTSCTVRCPLTISKLREVDEAFRKRGSSVPIVLVTLDPHTDTADRLLRFKEERHLPDNWHLLRGGDAATRAFARYLHVDPAYDSGHIDHEVRIDVLDAKGDLARSLAGWSFDPDRAVVR
jgi:cytochrome oxidase Cu insertion factor (SCO1/SenC/PrrC family)